MTKKNAFWRLFPAALFTTLGLVWCYAWRFDGALTAIAVCVEGITSSWLVITIVEVAKTMSFAPPQSRIVKGSLVSNIVSEKG